jgi:hypothetical protein
VIAGTVASSSQHEPAGHIQYAHSAFARVELKDLLLSRKGLQDGDAAKVLEAPVERVFESYIANTFLSNIPKKTSAVLFSLSSTLAERLKKLGADDRMRIYKILKIIIRPETEEFWEGKEPIRDEILAASRLEALDKLILSYLTHPYTDKVKTIAGVFLMRELLRASETVKKDTIIAEAVSKASSHYCACIMPTKQIPVVQVKVADVGHQGRELCFAGITTLGQTSAVSESWMKPALKPLHLRQIDPDDPYAKHCLLSGNPVVTGLSGTSNIFLFVAPALLRNFDASARDHLIAVLTCVLTYAGGHSINEVLEVAQMVAEIDTKSAENNFADGVYREPKYYYKAEARHAFSMLMTRIGETQVIDTAFEDTVAHFENNLSDCKSSSDPSSSSDTSGEELEIVVRKKRA